MPQTNNQIVTEAYQLVGIVADGKPCTPTQGQLGVTALNDMLLSEAVDGMRLNWIPQTFSTQWNSNAPLADSNIGDVKYMLCVRLAVRNGITIEDPMLLQEISNAIGRLNKRSLRMFESDLGELQRPQSGISGTGGWGF